MLVRYASLRCTCCVHVGEICESKRFYVFKVPDVDFIMLCGVLFLLCFITSWTYVVVSVILVVCSLAFSYLCVCSCCVFYV